MANFAYSKNRGFALIVSMLVLLVLTILVIGSVRNTALSERMAGNYMDRNRAMQAAEQGLRQAEALLLANGEVCWSGCAVFNGVVSASAVSLAAIPSTWSDAGAKSITLATGQDTSAKFQIAQLSNALRPATKTDCKMYSIMGQGKGLDSRAEVILQTLAYVCSLV